MFEYDFTLAHPRHLSATGGTSIYAYDGQGQRVQKTDPGGAPKMYVYDAFGQLAAEYASAPAASAACTPCYVSADPLGSVRLVTDQVGNVLSRHDYLPFGEEVPNNQAGRTHPEFAAADGLAQRFTGKERDSESGLDFFGARYCGSALGRFLSPDPLNVRADPTDPQSWNGYAYTGNNPLSRTDPNGLHYQESVNFRGKPICGFRNG